MLKTFKNSGRNFSVVSLVLIIACCYLSSCKKDEDNTPLPTLITVVSGDFTGKYSVLVTDSTGDILAQSSIEPNSSLELKSVKPYNSDNINVFYHTNSLDGNSLVTGYVKIKKGFVLKMPQINDNSSIKSVQVHVKDGNANFSKLQIITDAEYREFYSLSDTANRMVLNFSPNRDMFVQVEKSGALFYKFYTIDQSTGVTIDISEVNTPMAKKSIVLPLNTSYLSTYTMCKINSNDKGVYFLGLRALQGNIFQDTYEFNYPPAELFQYQRHFISWNDYANLKESYGNMYNKGIPDKLQPLKLSCNVENSKPSQFKVAFNGDLNFYLVYFYHGNNTVNLTVSEGVKEFKLPDLGQIFNDQNLNMSAFELRQITGINVPEFPKENFLDNYIKYQEPVTEIYDTQYKYFSFPLNN